MDKAQAARDLITNKRNNIQAQMNPADGDYSESYTQLTSALYDFQNTLLAQESNVNDGPWMDDNANWLSESKKRLFDWDLQRTEKKRGHVAQFSIHHQLEDIKAGKGTDHDGKVVFVTHGKAVEKTVEEGQQD